MAGKRWITWLPLVVAFAAIVAGVAVWVALGTEPRPADAGEERAVGFFDPHLRVAVVDVEHPVRWAGRPPDGRYWLVTVRARNDASEGDFVADPSKLEIRMEDGSRAWAPLPVPPQRGRAPTVRFDRPLAAGELDVRTVLFDLPEVLTAAELWVTWDDPLTRRLPLLRRSVLNGALVWELTL